jgi:hypothetical protein
MRNLLKGAGIAYFWLFAGLLVLVIAALTGFTVENLTDNHRLSVAVFYVAEIAGQIALAVIFSPSRPLRGLLGRSVCQGLHVTAVSLYLMMPPLSSTEVAMLAVGLTLGTGFAMLGHWLASLKASNRA